MIQPRKWSVPLGSGADVQDLPDDDLRYASFSKIFPQITQVPLPAGGVAPRRIDFNSLFKLLADNIYFYQNGGVFEYSDTADYEKGALVRYNDNIYLCIQDNSALNVHNPEEMDYWLRVALNNELSDYLPLAGGNVTGNLTVKNKNVVRTINDVEADVNGNVVIESGTSYEIGQRIESLIPLTNAMLHPTDGAVISGSGSYAEFVTLMAGKVSTNPELFCTEAEWQTSNTNYGFCGKFVYDDVANTVRLPKVNSEHGALIKSYQSGTQWYRIYQDGWCEQGGTFTRSDTSIALYKPYKDTFYNVSFDFEINSGSSSDSSFDIFVNSVSKTVDQFVAHSFARNIYTYDTLVIYWVARGYTDISDLQTAPIYEYIVVGTVSKTDIQIDIDNVLTDLNGKADTDLSNVTPNQVFKTNSVGWVMPDYSAGVSINMTTAYQSYTCPSDGVVVIGGTITNDSTNASLIINGTTVGFGYNAGSSSYNSCCNAQFIVSKDDICQFKTQVAGQATFTFYPCKGV